MVAHGPVGAMPAPLAVHLGEGVPPAIDVDGLVLDAAVPGLELVPVPLLEHLVRQLRRQDQTRPHARDTREELPGGDNVVSPHATLAIGAPHHSQALSVLVSWAQA